MLTQCLLAHPDAHPDVLARLVEFTDSPYDTAVVALRTGNMPLLLTVAPALYSCDAVAPLHDHPDVTNEGLAILIHQTLAPYWLPVLRTLPPGMLRHVLSRQGCINRDGTIRLDYAVEVALNPGLPDDMLDEVLRSVARKTAAPGPLLSALDIHRPLSTANLAPLYPNVAAALKRYRRHGSLPEWVARTRDLTTRDAVDIASYTASADAARAAMRRFPDPDVLSAVISNSSLPVQVRHEAIVHAAKNSSEGVPVLRDAARAWHSWAADTPTNVLDAVLSSTSDQQVLHELAMAALPAGQLPRLLDALKASYQATPAGHGAASILALTHVAARPDLTTAQQTPFLNAARDRLDHLTANLSYMSKLLLTPRAIVAAAEDIVAGRPASGDDLPLGTVHRNNRFARPLITRLVAHSVCMRPDVLTNPDVATAALRLEARFDGTFGQLLDTATNIAT